MRKKRFIGVVGHKKSGKTSLIEQLAKELTLRGLIVGTIKMTTHDLEFDTPGKDTHRHRSAGSKVTLIKSKSEMAIYSNSDYMDDVMIYAIFQKCDFVFVEGDSQSKNPKIYVLDGRGVRNDISGEIIAIWGNEKAMTNIPSFGIGQLDKLCDFLLSR